MASTGLRVVNRHHVALDFNWTTVQDFALWRALHEVASTARGDVMCGLAFTHYRVVDGEMLPVVTRMGPYTVVDSDISETLDEGYSMVRLAGAIDFDPNASGDDSVDNDLDLFTAVSLDPVGEGSRRVDLEWVAAANADDVFKWRDLLIYGPDGRLDLGRLGDNDDVYVEHGRDIHGLSEHAHFTLDFYSIDILDESSPADRDALATAHPAATSWPLASSPRACPASWPPAARVCSACRPLAPTMPCLSSCTGTPACTSGTTRASCRAWPWTTSAGATWTSSSGMVQGNGRESECLVKCCLRCDLEYALYPHPLKATGMLAWYPMCLSTCRLSPCGYLKALHTPFLGARVPQETRVFVAVCSHVRYPRCVVSTAIHRASVYLVLLALGELRTPAGVILL
ncbi:hypothetical protein GHT06_003825 [Daphnia sinensis]|uniref:Uncharacterized protein n=1 Tax=Daphnia sinensis TaxID=1820382 RepID=A0AAD5KDS4_9CRUS|nr:hypothetical protein GHT06_003825 [Daphnia sinensis]